MPPRTAPSLLSTPLIKPGGSQQSRPIEIEIAYSWHLFLKFLNYWDSVLIFVDRYFCYKDFFSIFFSQIGTFETNQHLPRLLGRLLIVDISKILKHVMSFWINIKITRWYVPNFKQTSRSQLISQSWLRLVGLFFGLDCLDKGIDLNRFCLNYREQTFEAGNSFSNVKI